MTIKPFSFKIKSNDFKCDVCDKLFASVNVLKVHNRVVHKAQEKKIPKVESDKHVRFLHEKEQRKPKRFVCEHCGKGFATKQTLSWHFSAIHQKMKFKCEQCDTQSSTKEYIRKHILNVHQNLRFGCEECESKFTRKQTLRAHVDSKHNKIIHQCNQCSQSFTLKSNLRRHKKKIHG